MRTLQRQLGSMFKPRAGRKPDSHRAAREQAKRIALQRGIEVEPLQGGGFNGWPPRALDPGSDPFEGDHYAGDWSEVLEHVQGYEKVLSDAASEG